MFLYMLHMLQKAIISSLKVINRYFYTPVAAMSACCKSIVGSYTEKGSDRTLMSNVQGGKYSCTADMEFFSNCSLQMQHITQYHDCYMQRNFITFPRRTYLIGLLSVSSSLLINTKNNSFNLLSDNEYTV